MSTILLRRESWNRRLSDHIRRVVVIHDGRMCMLDIMRIDATKTGRRGRLVMIVVRQYVIPTGTKRGMLYLLLRTERMYSMRFRTHI